MSALYQSTLKPNTGRCKASEGDMAAVLVEYPKSLSAHRDLQ